MPGHPEYAAHAQPPRREGIRMVCTSGCMDVEYPFGVANLQADEIGREHVRQTGHVVRVRMIKVYDIKPLAHLEPETL